MNGLDDESDGVDSHHKARVHRRVQDERRHRVQTSDDNNGKGERWKAVMTVLKQRVSMP